LKIESSLRFEILIYNYFFSVVPSGTHHYRRHQACGNAVVPPAAYGVFTKGFIGLSIKGMTVFLTASTPRWV